MRIVLITAPPINASNVYAKSHSIDLPISGGRIPLTLSLSEEDKVFELRPTEVGTRVRTCEVSDELPTLDF